jgi:amino acid adenylation domain-containing protein
MLTLIELEQEQIDRIVRSVPGGAPNVQDIYPLAPLQQGILFHHLLDPGRADAYVVPTLFYLQSTAQAQLLIQAVQESVNRHDVLRTAVLWDQLPHAVQVVYRHAQLPVEVVALDAERAAREQAQAWLLPEHQKMELTRAPLLRLRMAEDSQGGCYVLLQLHHIVADVSSLRQIIAEFTQRLQAQEVQLPASRPYREHIARVLDYRRESNAEAFFRDKLGSVEEATAPFALLNVHSDGSDSLEARCAWDESLAKGVHRQARRLGVSVASVLHAAWAMVVASTSGRDDVVFGTVLLGRAQSSADTRQALGMFINSLPLRIQLRHVSAEQLVRQAHRELAHLLEHELAELALAQRCSGVDSTQPLFTALLNYVHGSVDLESQFASVPGMQLLGTRSTTNYPIVLSIGDTEETFRLEMKTDRQLDPARMLDYMTTATASLVAALESAPQTLALKLRTLPEMEWRQVIETFNTPRAVSTPDTLIHELFERQAARRPNAVAVCFEGQTLSYSDLNAAANRLAHYLIEKGVRSDQLVGLCIERSLDLIVAVLGILKAGGAYLPLDPTYPPERLQHMLTDAAPAVVVTHEHLRAVLPKTSAILVTLDGECEEIGRRSADNVRAEDQGIQQLAYVIYTSGSTGKPKGVMIEHRNVTRLFSSTDAWFGFDERCVWTLFHSIAFDFSVWELWGALLYGGRVVVVPHSIARSPQDFYRLLCDERVTVLNQTPSAFAQLIDAQSRNPTLEHSLQFVIFGGEALEFHTLRPWIERNGAQQPQLINMYGITETTVHVTYRALSAAEIESERGSLIGRAIPDLSIYLLDAAGQPVPVGVTGEIHVGGAGVARGYLNRPELTSQRFVDDPFSSEPQARMYRSGDLGRWRADGTLEYLGRNDHQVKIRGFRIELGEIEARLAQHACVRDAVVIAREDVAGDKRLVAYVVPCDGATASLEADELRTHLKATLPEYMVPSAFVMLKQLPLTPNGKLDKKGLPTPQLDAYGARVYEPPQGDTEIRLAEVWRELLQIERVGRGDSFFELGGHSLSAMQLMARISARLSVEVPVRSLFDRPRLQDLAAEIQQALATSAVARIPEEGQLDELLEEVMSLPESEIQAWLDELRMEERR